MKSFGFLPAQSNFPPLLTVSLPLLSVQSMSACSLLTVTNGKHHYIHTQLFIHKKILTWRYEKPGCPSLDQTPLAERKFELEKRALEATLVSSSHSHSHGPQRCCLCFYCLHHGGETPAHTPAHTHAPPSLTGFQGCRALHADDGPAAHCGAGAQVEQVLADGFQVPEGPLGGAGVADVHRLHGPRLRLVDWMEI